MTTPRSDETSADVKSSQRDARSGSLQRMVRRCGAWMKGVLSRKAHGGLMSPATAYQVLGPHTEWPDEEPSQSSAQEKDGQQAGGHE